MGSVTPSIPRRPHPPRRTSRGHLQPSPSQTPDLIWNEACSFLAFLRRGAYGLLLMPKVDYAIAIGGEAGQGIATPGDILARIFVRRGLQILPYNAYQSIIRGGHIFLTLRVSDGPVRSHGDKLDALIA